MFKFESVGRNLVLLLFNFMEENAYSHVYIVQKRHRSLREFSQFWEIFTG